MICYNLKITNIHIYKFNQNQNQNFINKQRNIKSCNKNRRQIDDGLNAT